MSCVVGDFGSQAATNVRQKFGRDRRRKRSKLDGKLPWLDAIQQYRSPPARSAAGELNAGALMTDGRLLRAAHDGLQEEDLQRLLKCADGTGVAGEGRFEVSDHLLLRTVRLDDGPLAKSVQSRTQPRLLPFEAFPNAVGSTVADVALQLTQRLEFVAVIGDTLEKLPEVFCSQAQPSDFVGRPDAKRPAAPILARFAIVAEDSPRPR